ncbi:hypothetical protein U1Q18_041081 [Sarracenia purpurea var. burkii]
MGGCAAKPKELKADAAKAPAPEPAKDEASGKSSEAKEVIVREELKRIEGEIVIDKGKEIVDDGSADEPAGRRRSLSNLFKENDGKDSTEHGKMPSDPVKQEDPLIINQKPTDASEKNPHESRKTENHVDKITRNFVDAPVEIKTEETVMETPKLEDKKIVLEEKSAEETQKIE